MRSNEPEKADNAHGCAECVHNQIAVLLHMANSTTLNAMMLLSLEHAREGRRHRSYAIFKAIRRRLRRDASRFCEHVDKLQNKETRESTAEV